MNRINLNNLTEYQKSLLTRLSYLNIDCRKFEYVKMSKYKDKITISDLKFLISNFDELYIGSLHFPKLKKAVTNIDTTNIEFIEILEKAGLGELEIIDFVDNKETGFNGICFKDSSQNVGFSFRGTDLKSFSRFAVDGANDVEAYLTNNTVQIDQAQRLFDKHKNISGLNFLYGHSLGGFLAENVYLQNYGDVTNTFVVNPLHINSQLLDNEEKVDAFNDPSKFSCFVTGGDYVSDINTPDLFLENVNYVENSDETANNPLGNHMIEAGKFDENGNFVRCSKESAFEGYSAQVASDVIQFIKKEKVKSFFNNAFGFVKKMINSVKRFISKWSRNTDIGNEMNESKSNEKKLSEFDRYVDVKNYPIKNKEIIETKKYTSKEEEYTL